MFYISKLGTYPKTEMFEIELFLNRAKLWTYAKLDC